MVENFYLDLSYGQVAIAAGLVLINGLISVVLGLGLGRRLAVASVRTVVQLLLVGLALGWVFERSRAWEVVGLGVLMMVIAAFAALGRSDHRYPGMWLSCLISIAGSATFVLAITLTAVVDVDPWFRPQYAIPLLGMILGNALTGVSLGLDRLGGELLARRREVESLLAMGATRWEAAADSVRRAVRTGMVPIINSMMVVGLVSLPGMMTGQLLAGVAPTSAVKYQIVIMFLIAAATGLGTVSVVLLSYRRLFNEHHQFLYDLIEEKKVT